MKETIRVGILSDTHGLLRPQVEETLKGCDRILHAGDFDCGRMYDQIRRLGPPLTAVRGNNDLGRWAEKLPDTLRFTIGGLRFLMIHDRQDLCYEEPTDVDVILFGHSHRFCYDDEEGVLWLNPGSCGKRRFGLPLTMCVMEISDGKYMIDKMDVY